MSSTMATIHRQPALIPVPGNRSSVRGGRRLVVFHLAGQAYALDLAEVQEIVLMAGLSRPPGLPAVLEGFLNLAGAVVPVVRLDRLFRLPERAPGMFTPLLILRNPDHHVALMVDHVSEILTVTDDAVVRVRENQAFNDCAEGVVTIRDRVVLVLAAGRVLLEKEAQSFAEFESIERERAGRPGAGRAVSPSPRPHTRFGPTLPTTL